MADSTEYPARAARSRPGSSSLPSRSWGYHLIHRTRSVEVRDCVCHHGVRSAASEGAYTRARIGVIVGGAFLARSPQGTAVVGAGAMVLGNPGMAYEYRHLEDGGDRSIVFDYDGALLDELAPGGFRRASVPPSTASAFAITLARHALCSGSAEALYEAALAVALAAAAWDQGSSRTALDSTAQARRVSQVLRYIEAHHDEDCSLDALAARLGLSSFHFLRLFRDLTGQTPRQVVIAARLRASATALRATRAPIREIALDVGFGDLSHFTASFTRAFGISPAAYRRRAAVPR